jgi:hypothetical protein
MTPARKGPDGEGSVYQRASDGLWVAAVTLPSGRRKVVYGKTEREAPKARRDLLRDVETGRPVPLGRTPKLGAYLARWLDRIASEVTAGHIRPRTGDSYRDLIERHVLSTFLADVKLNALSADDIRAWQRLRLTEKRQRTRKGTEARPGLLGWCQGMTIALSPLRRTRQTPWSASSAGPGRRCTFLLVPAGRGRSVRRRCCHTRWTRGCAKRSQIDSALPSSFPAVRPEWTGQVTVASTTSAVHP